MAQSARSVLVIDDEESVCKFIYIILNKEGYDVKTATIGDDALKIVKEAEIDCILLDIIMPQMDGIDLLNEIKKINSGIPVIMMSAVGTHDRVIKAFEKGAVDFIAKPFNIPQIKEAIKDAIAKHSTPITPGKGVSTITEKVLKQSYIDLLATMTKILEIKDRYTKGHSERVKEYSIEIGQKLGLKDDELEIIEYAAMLHDIGKIAVSDVILLKPGRLNDEEWAVVKKHPAVSSDILSSLKLLHAELPAVRHHHERFDGKGYPDGLKGEVIPLYARILALADAYDAMTSARPYREALSKEDAIREIEKGKGSQFDPRLADIFLELIRGKNNRG